MPKILSYRMTQDSGFAPNPFWDVLTLAACTPNHARANLEPGDWIIGIEANSLKKKRINASLCPEIDNLVIYVAEVNEILSLNEYFHDKRFENKKYAADEGWEKRRGDNIYYKEDGMWKWIRGHEHDNKYLNYFPTNDIPDCGLISQDIKGNRVFISWNFSYFGDKCIELDRKFLPCITKTHGIKYCYSSDSFYDEFLNYIQDLMKKNGKGKVGNPILCTIGERSCKEKEKKRTSCKG